ncbi:MAG TPA: substrate-binding domain-containing protein [Chthoniobacteraceae bacterium]|nr:substrate-binding domain-containing protein [Chthoniobacteraceae bacterium]
MDYLHERLTRSLLEEMASGTYREGEHFFSLRSIQRLWKVSGPTVASSVKSLGEHGLLQASFRRGYILQSGFQQKAQLLLQRNRVLPLKPLRTLQQKARLLREVRGGKVAMLLEMRFAPDGEVQPLPDGLPPCELRSAVRAFESAARRLGFEGVRLSYGGKPGEAESIREKLAAGNFQGALVHCRSSHQMIPYLLEPLISRQLPIVTIFDDCSGLPVSSVNVNNVGLGYDSVRRLYRMGHRRIAVLTRRHPLKVQEARLKGALMAQSEKNWGDARIECLRFDPDRPVPNEIQAFFADPSRRPTAVFACESRLLRALAPVWERLRLSVPGDLSVLMASSRRTLPGFDVPLDAMQLKAGARVGRLAAKLLYRIQLGEPLGKTALLDIAYIRRGSVRKLTVPN